MIIGLLFIVLIKPVFLLICCSFQTISTIKKGGGMEKFKVFTTYFFLFLLCLSKISFAQKIDKSNSALAINYVYFDASNNSYHFGYANNDVYEYRLLNGSLNGLRAYDKTFGEYFLPSNYGGAVVKFNNDITYPWNAGVLVQRKMEFQVV